MKRRRLPGLAVALGLLLGYVDLHVEAVQVSLLLLLALPFVFAFWKPERAWRWALLIGLGVPVAHFLAVPLGYTPPYGPPSPNRFVTFVALAPAIIGAYSGALARKLASRARAGGSN